MVRSPTAALVESAQCIGAYLDASANIQECEKDLTETETDRRLLDRLHTADWW